MIYGLWTRYRQVSTIESLWDDYGMMIESLRDDGMISYVESPGFMCLYALMTVNTMIRLCILCFPALLDYYLILLHEFTKYKSRLIRGLKIDSREATTRNLYQFYLTSGRLVRYKFDLFYKKKIKKNKQGLCKKMFFLLPNLTGFQFYCLTVVCLRNHNCQYQARSTYKKCP